jgi:AcrR family transcriptional regulator
VSEKRETRKDQIFSVGARLFAEKGYERTSLQEVADLLGVTKPALYYYYDSKEQLLFEIMSFVMDRVLQDAVEISGSSLTPAEKLHEMIRRYVGFFAAHPAELTLMSTAGDSLGADLRAVIVERERQYLQFVRGIVAELLDGHRGKDVHETSAAFALLGGMSWIFKWYDPDGAITPEQLAGDFLKIYSYGLLGNCEQSEKTRRSNGSNEE